MNARAPVNPRKLLTWLGLVAGFCVLMLQFGISMRSYLASGRDMPGALGAFFMYYTILTNSILVLVYVSEVLPTARLELFRHPVLRGMMVASMALVSLFVFFVLRHLYMLEGPSLLADNLLHYICPLLYLLWWISVQRHGLLQWSNLPVMLLPTVVYFIYVIARGAWVQEYPYPVLNAIELGYGQVLINAVFMTVGLGILASLVILLDHVLTRRWNIVHD